MSKENFLQKFKAKYQIKSNLDLTLILITFSLAGMNISLTRPKIFHFLGLDHAPLWAKILSFPLIFFPVYQISVLFYAALLGQFSFFWERQKKMGRFLRDRLRPKSVVAAKSI